MELKEYKLGDIAEISTGYPFDGNLYAKEGIRVLRGENIGDGILKWDDRIDKRWNAPFSKSDVYTLCDGDIVMQMDGNVGRNKSRVFAHDLPMLIAQRVGCIRAKKEIADQDFLYYVICSEHYLRYINKVKTGTSIHHISLSQISNYTLSIPPLITQKRIADVLSSFDKQIALNKQINQNLEALARQLYDYWFVQFDFPDANGKPYKSSGGKMVYNPILKREIPEGWEVKEMEEIIDIKSGFPFQSTTYLSKGEYSIITIKNVQDGFLDLSGTDFLDELPPRIPDYCILKRGDILISLTGNIGRVGRVFSDNLLLNQRVGYVDCKNQYNNWAYLYITSSQVRLQIEKLGIGSAQLNVSPIQIGKIKLALPTDQVLSSFDKKLAAILEHILANSNEIASLTKQRDELLPLLMNGQVNFDLSDD